MVRDDIVGRGVTDQRVQKAMMSVRRDRFVSGKQAAIAYRDRPLPIGEGQTISQPFIVAYMAEAAEIGAEDRVLEIGTGSGYGAAVLAHLAQEVWTVECRQPLVISAQKRLDAEGFANVHVVLGDGTLGWPDSAPFEAIVVTAAGPNVPPALCDQLVDGGRLVLPVGPQRGDQRLVRVRRAGNRFVEDDLGGVRFVPLIGEQGWDPPDAALLS